MGSHQRWTIYHDCLMMVVYIYNNTAAEAAVLYYCIHSLNDVEMRPIIGESSS